MMRGLMLNSFTHLILKQLKIGGSSEEKIRKQKNCFLILLFTHLALSLHPRKIRYLYDYD